MEFFLLSQRPYQMFVSIQTSNGSDIDQVVFNWILEASLTYELVEWTPIQIGTTQNNVLTLEARTRVFCSRNYYGIACTKRCYSKNPSNRNLRCDPDGNIVCLEGYTNVTTNCITRESIYCKNRAFIPSILPTSHVMCTVYMLLTSWQRIWPVWERRDYL